MTGEDEAESYNLVLVQNANSMAPVKQRHESFPKSKTQIYLEQ